MASPALDVESREKVIGTPAPYGRACTNCSRAKCRCLYSGGGNNNTCDRCHRLKKECVSSVSVRKRNGRRGVLSSRTAQLEEKLEDLVTLLKNQQPPGQGPHPPSTIQAAQDAATGIITPSTSARSGHSPFHRIDEGTRDSHTPESGVSDVPGPQNAEIYSFPSITGSKYVLVNNPGVSISGECKPCRLVEDPPSILSSASEPTPLEAEERLRVFREHMLCYLPFVFISDTMSAKELRGKYPFLWFNIMTVTARSVAQQIKMSDSLKQFVSQKLVVDYEKNMDMLLGLLCVLGWTHIHRKERPFLSIISSLAMALVYDLELNKILVEPSMMMCFKTWDHPWHRRQMDRCKVRTMEERRTVLSAFFLTSQVAYTMKRIDGLAWTSHMEECLEALSKAPECPGDEQLVAQVRLQLIVDQVYRLPSQLSLPHSYVSTLHAQVETIKEALSPRLKQNDAVIGQLIYTDLVIQDFVLQRTPVPQHVSDFQRHELLTAHLNNIKKFFDSFFEIKSDSWVGMSFPYWCCMAHGLIALFRLTTISNDPSWDRHAVLADVNLFSILERVADGFDQEAARRRLTAGDQAEEDIMMKAGRILRLMKDGWLAELKALNNQQQTGHAGPSGEVPGGIAADGGAAQIPMPGVADASANPSMMMNQPNGVDFTPDMDAVFPMTMPMMMMNDAAWLSDIFNVSWE